MQQNFYNLPQHKIIVIMKPITLLLLMATLYTQHNLAQNIGIGTAAPAARLHIKGTQDSAQLLIDHANTQSITTPAIKIRRADGTELFWLNANERSSLYLGYNTAANIDGYGSTQNTVVGTEAASGTTFGFNGTAIGYRALYNAIGSYNTAVGNQAMFSSLFSQQNTAVGSSSMYSNYDGDLNVSVGEQNMYYNLSGSYNTSVGWRALYSTTGSQYNTAIGYMAGGQNDNGYNNVFLGANTRANGAGYYNVIAIGQDVTCTASSQVRIGNTATSSIGGYVGWSNLSDGRFKRDIRENVPGLDFIMRLKPVTYHLNITALRSALGVGTETNIPAMEKDMASKEKALQTGFVAQDVEKAANALGYEFSGVDKPGNSNDFYCLRYSEFVVPLVKAVQEQQQQILALQKQNKELMERITKLEQ